MSNKLKPIPQAIISVVAFIFCLIAMLFCGIWDLIFGDNPRKGEDGEL